MEKQELSIARPSLLRAWWPALVWVGIIAIESTDLLSSEHTGSLLYKLITKLFRARQSCLFPAVPLLPAQDRARGCVRPVESLIAARLANDSRSGKGVAGTYRNARMAGNCFVASMDEWHQSFIPSRTGTWHDVVLDSTAGAVFLFIANLWLRRGRVNQPA